MTPVKYIIGGMVTICFLFVTKYNDKKTFTFDKIQKTKRENAFMFIVNQNMKFALATMIINIQTVVKNIDYDLIVLYDGLTSNDITDLKKLDARLQFVEYTLTDWISEHKEPISENAKSFISRYSHLAYCKYKVYELSRYYKHALFLDLDMLIRDDISDIFKLDGVAWKSGILFHKAIPQSVSLKDFPETQNIPSDYPNPNGGLIYVSLTPTKAEACLKHGNWFIVNFMDYIRGACDELAISYPTYAENIKLTTFNYREYNALPKHYLPDTKIIHYMGSRKIWNNDIMQLMNPEWYEYYEKALEIADFSSDKVIYHHDRGATYKKYIFENQWLNFLRETKFSLPNTLKYDYHFEKSSLKMIFQDNIFYEFNFDEDDDSFTYRIKLIITSKQLTSSVNFKNALKDLRLTNISKLFFDFTDDKLIVSTPKYNMTRINELFLEFYNATIDLLQPNATFPKNKTFLEKTAEKYDIQIPNHFLRNINDISNYLSTVINSGYTIIMCAKDDCSKYFDNFNKLLPNLLNEHPNFSNSYCCIISNGKNILECVDNNRNF